MQLDRQPCWRSGCQGDGSLCVLLWLNLWILTVIYYYYCYYYYYYGCAYNLVLKKI